MILKVKNINKYYGKHHALSNFSMTIKSGEIVGLIGKNGSGKTTLLNCIVNNIHISSGEIYVDDKNLLQHKHLIAHFGVLIESSFLDYLNAYENLKLLMMADGIRDLDDIDQQLNEVLKLVGLDKRKKEYVKSYSFGMKQRLGLAQALLNDKDLLILDEPLVGLDVMGRELVKNIIVDRAKKHGKAVIFSDHNLNEVKDVCDRIVYIDNGIKMYDGVFDEGTKFIITVESLNEQMRSLLLHEFGNHLEIEDNVVILKQLERLNHLLKVLTHHHIEIQDVDKVEGSLMSFFKGVSDNDKHKVDMEHRKKKTVMS